MTTLGLIKLLHVVSATFFFGAGLMSAFWKFSADGTGEAAVVAWASKQIVRADWWFTVPSGLLLSKITGLSWCTPTGCPGPRRGCWRAWGAWW